VRDLNALKETDITTVSPETLVDINNVEIKSGSKEERILEYVEKIKNPYCFLCEGYIVKLGFSNSEITLTDRLCNYVSKMAASGINE